MQAGHKYVLSGVAGAGSGIFIATVITPIEYIKCVLQVRRVSSCPPAHVLTGPHHRYKTEHHTPSSIQDPSTSSNMCVVFMPCQGDFAQSFHPATVDSAHPWLAGHVCRVCCHHST